MTLLNSIKSEIFEKNLSKQDLIKTLDNAINEIYGREFVEVACPYCESRIKSQSETLSLTFKSICIKCGKEYISAAGQVRSKRYTNPSGDSREKGVHIRFSDAAGRDRYVRLDTFYPNPELRSKDFFSLSIGTLTEHDSGSLLELDFGKATIFNKSIGKAHFSSIYRKLVAINELEGK